MKTLGGVGAVVMGAMLLLTVKIGPSDSKPAPSHSPADAVAAVPAEPPRSTPAAAAPAPPVRMLVVTEKSRVVAMPSGKAVEVPERKRETADPIVVPQPLEWTWTVELPGVACL